jgi:hypothetical protein
MVFAVLRTENQKASILEIDGPYKESSLNDYSTQFHHLLRVSITNMYLQEAVYQNLLESLTKTSDRSGRTSLDRVRACES